MKLFFKLILPSLFLLFCNFVFAEEYKQNYLVEVGGLNIGKLSWEVFLEKEKYTIKINLENKGLVSGIYKFSGKYETFGKIKKGILYASSYEQNWKTPKKNSYVKIYFENNKLDKLTLKPEEVEIPRIKYLGIKSYSDPLTSFLNILLGKKISKTIDGRRVYNMAAESEKYENNKEKIEISINEYVNIWTDHNKNDLKRIEFIKEGNIEAFRMPLVIKIKFKQLVFKLTKV